MSKDFFKKKQCICSICKNSIYDHTFSESISNTSNDKVDVLILMEFKELPEKLDSLKRLCDLYFKNNTYKIVYALGCTPKDFKLNDSIATYSYCKEQNIKKIISLNSPKVILTVGRALYTITEIKDLRPEHFYVPVTQEALLSFQEDDTHLWSKEFNCKVFPIPALYRWISNSPKDVYETKFVYSQFKRVTEQLKKREKIEPTKNLIYCDDPNKLLKSFIDNKDITAIAIDTETSGFNYFEDELYSIQFATDSKTGYFCYFKDIDKNLLIELFNRTDIDFVLQNSQFDLKFLIAKGIKNAHCTFDTMLAAHSLNENSPNGLKPLSWIYTKEGGYDFELKRYICKNKINSFLNLPKNLLLEYACYDVICTFSLYKYFKNRFELEDSDVRDNFFNYIMPAVEMIVDVEMTGVQLDMNYLYEYLKSLKIKAKEIEEELFQIAGKQYNIKSSKELSNILKNLDGFEIFKDDNGKELLTKNGDVKLGKELLDKYAKTLNLPFLTKISEYNHLTKEISQLGFEFDSANLDTYRENGKGFLQSLYKGRLHGGYKLHGTDTGRMSGGGGLNSTVNYQNMPTPKEFRKLFLSKGIMASADYTAMEVSILSQISGKGPLEELILNKKDMHCYTAAALYKLVYNEEISYEEIYEKTQVEGKEDPKFVKLRKDAKGTNFMCSYGATAYGISNEFGVSLEEGALFLKAYYDSYPEVEKYMEICQKQAKKFGYVKTLLGRKRRLPELTYIGKDSYSNKYNSTINISNLLNAAINAPIQGTSGQTTIIAMINIRKEFLKKELKSKILINVHDEIVFDIEENELEEAIKIIEYWMTYPYYKNKEDNKVHLLAEVKYGEVWKYGKTKDYWDKHKNEWDECISSIRKRNENLKNFSMEKQNDKVSNMPAWFN